MLLAAVTAAAVLAGMANSHKGLQSYSVPVTVTGTVHASGRSFPFAVTGTQYFQAPDKRAMRINAPPAIARRFDTLVSSLGSPATWEETYDIAIRGTQEFEGNTDDVLVATPRSASHVTNVAMLVNPHTYAIDSATFSYDNGGRIAFAMTYGANPHDLPVTALVSATFGNYSAKATIAYGAYSVNAAVPASVFQQ